MTTTSSVAGYEALVLENARLRAVILPQLGGRIWELEDRLRKRQWIWHREDVPLASAAPGAVYDDVWAGGWEELFPNDAPGGFEGRTLLDHGEWWTTAWTVADAPSDPLSTVRLVASTRTVRAACVKDIRLAADAPTLSITYRIRSEEREPFHFLFKQHLPVCLTPACRLRLPGGEVHQVDPGFGTLVAGGPSAWPLAPTRAGGLTDLRIVPARSEEAREFVYVRDLPEGWCAVEDGERRAALRFAFDRRHLPYVWLFLSYGGWRGTYTAVLEPCTNMPKDLAAAVRLGQSARLDPGQEFVTTATVHLEGVA